MWACPDSDSLGRSTVRSDTWPTHCNLRSHLRTAPVKPTDSTLHLAVRCSGHIDRCVSDVALSKGNCDRRYFVATFDSQFPAGISDSERYRIAQIVSEWHVVASRPGCGAVSRRPERPLPWTGRANRPWGPVRLAGWTPAVFASAHTGSMPLGRHATRNGLRWTLRPPSLQERMLTVDKRRIRRGPCSFVVTRENNIASISYPINHNYWNRPAWANCKDRFGSMAHQRMVP